MRVIEVPVQIRLADLLRAIERLSPAEFGVVASRVADLQRTQQAHADLLAQAQRSLAPAQQRRLKTLAAKAENGKSCRQKKASYNESNRRVGSGQSGSQPQKTSDQF